MVQVLSTASGNRFLDALPDELSRQVALTAESVPLRHGTVLTYPGDLTEHLYFPERGLISLVKIMEDGRSAEVGFIGPEGFAGAAALLGMEASAFELIVQVDGAARRIKTAMLRAEMDRNHGLKELVLRYIYYTMHRLAQTAACNRLHSLKQRCCRWLLVAHDSAREDSFTLTHDFLSLMMGVNRPALSLCAARLQRLGIIQYRRASLTVRDRAALESNACECYRTLQAECDRVYGV